MLKRAARQLLATDKSMRHTIYCDIADCLIAYQITIPAKEILMSDSEIVDEGSKDARRVMCVCVTRKIGRVKRI